MSTVKAIGLQYHKEFGFNVLPIRGKRPNILWDKWQTEKQTVEDIEKMDWSNATGAGVVLGNDDLGNLDLDFVGDYEFLDKLLEDLGLPVKYAWVIQSGSGEGFHVYFRIKDELGILIKKFGGDKAVFKFKPREKNICKHVEVRRKNCQTVLPPSLHESGGIYTFYYDEPRELPLYIDAEKLVEVISKYFEIEEEVTKKAFSIIEQKEEVTHYDKERLESALESLSKNLPSNCYEEWYRIGFALVPFGDEGRKYFVEMSLANPNYQDTEMQLNKKFDELVKDYDGRVTLGSLYHLAERFGWVKPIIKIWYWENERLKLSRPRLKRLLEDAGFCKLRIERKYIFARVSENIVHEITTAEVKEYVVFNYLNEMPVSEFGATNRDAVMDLIMKNGSQVFADSFFEFLITRPIKFCEDTKDSSFFFFKNGFVEVTKETKYLHPYENLKGCIWEDEIIDREYKETRIRSEFEDFLYNAIGKDTERMRAVRSAVGYMLHRKKKPGEEKAILLIDEIISDEASGRSGKGLTIRGIGKLRKTVILDGRTFSPGKNFAFQRVGVDCNIVAFDDLDKNFPFEKLFSVISDGMTIERKNKDEMYLPYEKSPKLICSTNYVMKGIDDSALDRQFVIEYTNHYNKNNRPIHEFGHSFFEGWKKEQWNQFDTFMLECVQLYLEKGLIPYPLKNMEEKQLINETSEDFAEFSKELQSDCRYGKNDLYKKYLEENPDWAKLSQRRFTGWLKKYGKNKGLKVEEWKSGSERYIEFKTEEQKGNEAA